ncbi:hypothetical protein ACFW3D_32005 [Streptomyces sp. NPDC058864]
MSTTSTTGASNDWPCVAFAEPRPASKTVYSAAATAVVSSPPDTSHPACPLPGTSRTFTVSGPPFFTSSTETSTATSTVSTAETAEVVASAANVTAEATSFTTETCRRLG